jgi:hypothetical protein
MVPVARSTAMAPPTMSRKKMIACASAMARGTAVSSDHGDSVTRSSVCVYVPGTTMLRPCSLTPSRMAPCGSSHVAIRATIMIANSSTSVCGTPCV